MKLFSFLLLLSTAAAWAEIWPFKMGDNRVFNRHSMYRGEWQSKVMVMVTVIDSFVEAGKLNYEFNQVDSTSESRAEKMDTLSEDYQIPKYDWNQRPNCEYNNWYPDSSRLPERPAFTFQFQGTRYKIFKTSCFGSAGGGPSTAASFYGTTYVDSTLGIIYRKGVTVSGIQACGIIDGQPNCYVETTLESLNNKAIDAMGIVKIADSLEVQSISVRRIPKAGSRSHQSMELYRLDGRQVPSGARFDAVRLF